MSKMREVHPGAKLFFAAVAELSCSASRRKSKSPNKNIQANRIVNKKPTKPAFTLKEPVTGEPESSDILNAETSDETDNNCQKCSVSDQPVDDPDDYSLPVTQTSPPPGFNLPQSTSIDSEYHPANPQFGYVDNDCATQPSGFSTEQPCYSTPDNSAYHPQSSSTIEYHSSPQYYPKVAVKLEPSSVSIPYPPGFSSVPNVYSRPLLYDPGLQANPVGSDVLEHHSMVENVSPHQRSCPSNASMYNSQYADSYSHHSRIFRIRLL